MNCEMNVEPWFHYPVNGGAPSLRVLLKTEKTTATLVWSTRFGRFSKGWNLMNFRRANPQAHLHAAAAMRDMCSKMRQPVTVTSVTVERDSVTDSRKPGRLLQKNDVTLSRAHGPSATEKKCHAVTVTKQRDVAPVTRDSDRALATLRPVTVTVAAPVDGKQKFKDRMAADRRFAAWVAGRSE